ncbi:MAG TPA: glycosyltransferase [Thermoanaerobaculia bacterium]|nr:glycosyltransferase [Thermoanaerobaculia bacterium]
MKAKKKIVIFGLTVSSSWGNGHATLWRALLRSLTSDGHEAVFFERDVPYYASTRDLHRGAGYDLVLYNEWNEALPLAESALADADVAIVTSYCPDALAATDLIMPRPDVLHVFYDLDTPVTLDRLDRGETVEYLPHDGYARFDLVLSFTGGRALGEIQSRLGAKRALPLYGSVDATAHHPVAPLPHYSADLSYLGTYAPDRQEGVERLFIGAARKLPAQRFVLGGSMYPSEFPWTENIHFFHHVPPAEHPAFYCSSKLTLNVTRGAMASRGYCPSGRLFEAAACRTPILSDTFDGLDAFFEPGKEILLARSTEEAVEALQLPSSEIARIGEAAHKRVMAEHTSDVRAREMMRAFEL